jgi:hypothetical protein
MSNPERRRRVVVVLGIILITLAISLSNGIQANNQKTPQQALGSAGQSRLAVQALKKLPVKGRAARTGYSRKQFGGEWLEADGCDMRNQILKRDLAGVVTISGTDCTVLHGVLKSDPYTGKNIRFVRGKGTSQAIQIDHVVAVSDAWQKGAQRLTMQQRASFYNDPLNLLAVDGPANNKKGDGDAATWLPPNKSYRCRYAARQIAVKSKYALWVTSAEKDALARVLRTCPDQQLPVTARGNEN